jgi:hypothetical protein
VCGEFTFETPPPELGCFESLQRHSLCAEHPLHADLTRPAAYFGECCPGGGQLRIDGAPPSPKCRRVFRSDWLTWRTCACGCGRRFDPAMNSRGGKLRGERRRFYADECRVRDNRAVAIARKSAERAATKPARLAAGMQVDRLRQRLEEIAIKEGAAAVRRAGDAAMLVIARAWGNR